MTSAKGPFLGTITIEVSKIGVRIVPDNEGPIRVVSSDGTIREWRMPGLRRYTIPDTINYSVLMQHPMGGMIASGQTSVSWEIGESIGIKNPEAPRRENSALRVEMQGQGPLSRFWQRFLIWIRR
jgi:hypothetical protein